MQGLEREIFELEREIASLEKVLLEKERELEDWQVKIKIKQDIIRK